MRDVRPDDVDVISALYEVYVRTSVVTFALEPPTRHDWRATMEDVARGGWPFLVGTVGDELVGYAYVAPWRSRPGYRYTVEDAIYLAPGRTGRGYGTRLLAELLARAAAAGAHQVIAVIADSGDPASTALHARAGFAEVGRLRRVGHKHGRWIDTILMQRELDAGTPDQ